MIDFLIVGTPKSGTTALQSYLNQCEGIFMPSVKELHYFGEEFKSEGKKNIYYKEIQLEEYHDFFVSASPKDLLGEASVFYLYSESACKQIKEYNPKMKIVACFRNPVDFLISYHQDLLYVENENEKDFWKALSLEKRRKNGEQIPENNTLAMSLFYSELVNYSHWLKNYIDHFGRENIHVVIFEEFFSNPKKYFKELLVFLGTNRTSEVEFKKVNPRRGIKSNRFNSFIRRPGKIMRFFIRSLLPNQRLRLSLYNFLRKFNSSHNNINDLSLSDKERLYEMFKNNIIEFESLIGRDLPSWNKSNNEFI